MSYTKENYDEDIDWLRGEGVSTAEVDDFLINVVKQSFAMTRKEFLEFLKEG